MQTREEWKRRLRETGLAILWMALPVAAIVAPGAIAVQHMLHRAELDEAGELEAQAVLRLDALLGHADGAMRRDGGGAARKPPPRPRPPNAPPMAWSAATLKILPLACGKIEAEETAQPGATAFRIIDETGASLYSSRLWPVKHGMTGRAPLAPPLGDGFLLTARIDGGAAFRAERFRIAAAGSSILLLLAALHVVACSHFTHLRRHERRDAMRRADFFDCVSHDLKTPLAGIRLNAELLASGRMPEGSRRSAIDAIVLESDRLLGMVQRLLDARRLERGAFQYSMETFDLGDFAADETERAALAAVSRSRATVRISEKHETVCADRNILRLIASNLVDNAVKYSDGPVEIEVDGAEMRFLDRGPGVPPSAAKRIFDMYFRVDDKLTQKATGSGLGLHIARNAARGMGGDVTYAPRKGGGSVFTLKLRPAERRCRQKEADLTCRT